MVTQTNGFYDFITFIYVLNANEYYRLILSTFALFIVKLIETFKMQKGFIHIVAKSIIKQTNGFHHFMTFIHVLNVNEYYCPTFSTFTLCIIK